jgi:hypothetical protein
LTVAECEAQELPVRPDPLGGFPEHCVVDFTGFSSNRTEKASKRLRLAAEQRSWLYRAEGHR